jgi:hypothetical protein
MESATSSRSITVDPILTDTLYSRSYSRSITLDPILTDTLSDIKSVSLIFYSVRIYLRANRAFCLELQEKNCKKKSWAPTCLCSVLLKEKNLEITPSVLNYLSP